MAWQDLGQVVPDIEYIDIQASDYNPNVDDTITITITATNQSGSPIANQTYTLKENGETLTTLTTNSNGMATYTYICSNWGMCRFSVKTFSTFIKVSENRFIFQQKNISLSSTASQGASSGTATVTACPTGYTPYVVLMGDGWLNMSSWSLNDSTLTINVLNAGASAHSSTVIVLVIYYKDGAF